MTGRFCSRWEWALLWIAVAALFARPNAAQAQTLQALAPTNFSSQAIGSSSPPQTLTFTGMAPQVVAAIVEVSGTDFAGALTCNGSGTCNVAVTFTPKYPGFRQDATMIFNQAAPYGGGPLLGIGPVYGIGTGPQIATGPALISTFANRAANTALMGPLNVSASGFSSANLNGVMTGPRGRVYISDRASNSVYFIDPPVLLTLTRYAGNGTAGYSGDGGEATLAELNAPSALAIDASGNLYIADTGNNVIREVTVSSRVTTAVGNGTAGFSGDGGSATSAQLNSPEGVAVDAQGNLYIADTGNNRIRKVTAINGQITSDSTITTVAGTGAAGFSGDGGPATSAELYLPWGLALDANGNLFIADVNNSAIREVSGGTISTVAGTGATPGYTGDGGAAASARLNGPKGIAVDSISAIPTIRLSGK